MPENCVRGSDVRQRLQQAALTDLGSSLEGLRLLLAQIATVASVAEHDVSDLAALADERAHVPVSLG